MAELGDWFRTIPFFTRYWFGGTVAFTLLGRIGLLNPRYLILQYEPFIHGFQFWRPLTALFYYPLGPATGFHFLLNLYFLYNYSSRLENGVFSNRPADYCFMLVFNWICIVLTALFSNVMILMDPMVLSVLYVWCQLNKDTIVSFWFGTQFKAMYMPWVLLGFNMIISGGGLYELIGIVVGHLYFFLTFTYPQEYHGRQFLQTPEFLYRYFPLRQGGVAGVGQAPTFRRQDDGRGRHPWGQGRALGD